MVRRSKQHYVQKRLLSNFSINSSDIYDKQRIWVKDKLKKKIFQTNIKNIAERGFLNHPADSILTRVEFECFPIIKNIQRRKCLLCEKLSISEQLEAIFGLYRYLGIQLIRTPKWRNDINEREKKNFYLSVPKGTVWDRFNNYT